MCIFNVKPPKPPKMAPPPLVKAAPEPPDPVPDPKPLQEPDEKAELKIGSSKKADTAQQAGSIDSLRIPLNTAGADTATTGGLTT